MIVVCSVIAVASMLSTALAPMLPTLTRQYQLSRIDSGVLVGAYYIGLVSVAAPTLALGVRVFGEAGHAGRGRSARTRRDCVCVIPQSRTLVAGRWLQGAGAMFCWSGASGWLVDASPRERRGFAIGLVAGVSSVGAVAGHALGAVAEAAGRLPAFLALGGLAIGAGVVTMFLGEAVHDSDDGSISKLLRTQPAREILLPSWLVSVPGAVIGGLAASGPFALSREGWSEKGTAATSWTAPQPDSFSGRSSDL